MPVAAYHPLAAAIETALAAEPAHRGIVLALPPNANLAAGVRTLRERGAASVYLVGHGMTSAGIVIQDWTASHGQSLGINGLVLLNGFLKRHHRPCVRRCASLWSAARPRRSLRYPLGYLKDAAHDCAAVCDGPGDLVPQFPTPTLTLGAELDGVVRVTRIAEAYHTQASGAGRHVVLVVPGANHAAAFGSGQAPLEVAARDLASEVAPAAAVQTYAEHIAAFVYGHLGLARGPGLASAKAWTAQFFAPILEAFVQLEGSWFFSAADDEHGGSAWAAQAQPLLAGLDAKYKWATADEFRMLSDEPLIPPYYRPRHRPKVTISGSAVASFTVSQLRYIQLSLTEVGFGLNGFAIIKEEKSRVLDVVEDDGFGPVSAREIATKLASRQLVTNRSGMPAPPSLDDGDRCRAINNAAVAWVLANAGNATVSRYRKHGVPLLTAPDRKPIISAGPAWIWSYLAYSHEDGALRVSSYAAFYPLDANPYGAGNHYCKLLSPARALEWIYTDSLRKPGAWNMVW